MAKQISSLSATLTAGVAPFVTGMRKAREETVGLMGKLSGLASSMLKVTGVAGLVSGAIGGIGFGALVAGQLEAVDAAGKLSDRLGITTEKLAGLQHAANLSGVANEQLTGGLEKYLKAVAGAVNGNAELADAFRSLGLDARQLQALQTDQAIGLIADRLNAIQNPAQRAAAAVAIFGKSGQSLLPLLREGSSGLAAMDAEARALGLSFSRVEAARVEQANDAISRVKSAAVGAATAVAITLAPAISQVADAATELSIRLVALVKENLPAIGAAVQLVTTQLLQNLGAAARFTTTNADAIVTVVELTAAMYALSVAVPAVSAAMAVANTRLVAFVGIVRTISLAATVRDLTATVAAAGGLRAAVMGLGPLIASAGAALATWAIPIAAVLSVVAFTSVVARSIVYNERWSESALRMAQKAGLFNTATSKLTDQQALLGKASQNIRDIQAQLAQTKDGDTRLQLERDLVDALRQRYEIAQNIRALQGQQFNKPSMLGVFGSDAGVTDLGVSAEVAAKYGGELEKARSKLDALEAAKLRASATPFEIPGLDQLKPKIDATKTAMDGAVAAQSGWAAAIAAAVEQIKQPQLSAADAGRVFKAQIDALTVAVNTGRITAGQFNEAYVAMQAALKQVDLATAKAGMDAFTDAMRQAKLEMNNVGASDIDQKVNALAQQAGVTTEQLKAYRAQLEAIAEKQAVFDGQQKALQDTAQKAERFAQAMKDAQLELKNVGATPIDQKVNALAADGIGGQQLEQYRKVLEEIQAKQNALAKPMDVDTSKAVGSLDKMKSAADSARSSVSFQQVRSGSAEAMASAARGAIAYKKPRKQPPSIFGSLFDLREFSGTVKGLRIGGKRSAPASAGLAPLPDKAMPSKQGNNGPYAELLSRIDKLISELRGMNRIELIEG